MVRIGLAFYAPLFGADALAWAVAADCAGRLAVNLHQHGIVDIGAEGFFHGREVGAVTVAGELHPIGEPQRRVADEVVRSVRVTAADKP